VSLALDGAQIKPMYRDILAIDLGVTLQTARAENFDIRRARQAVEASFGEWESAVGGVFPAIGPAINFEHVNGTVRAVQGNLVGASFNTFQPAMALQWISNPGHVIFDLIASRKRLSASEHQERAVITETLRLAGVQYYDLVLAQAQVKTFGQAVAEARNCCRITRLRVRTGTGVIADELRAQANLAQRQQDLVSTVNAFYQASVALAVTLHLDSSVTLVPSIRELPQIRLVRTDLSLDELLELAIAYRPDLKSVRNLVEAAAADRGATWWGSLGPQFTLGYQYSGITGHANNVIPGKGISPNLIVNPVSASGSFVGNPLANGVIKEAITQGSARLAPARDQTAGFSRQERWSASAGWHFTLSAFGDLRTARAIQEQAIVDAERLLDQVKAQVALANEASRTNAELAALAEHQVASAEEALRLSQANLQAGTMATLDVLQAEDAVEQARLRHAEAVIRYNQSQINLLAAMGLAVEHENPEQIRL